MLQYVKDESINTDQIISLTKEFPKFYRVWFGPLKPNIVLVHPESIKVLLKTAGKVYITVYITYIETYIVINEKQI